MARPSSFSTFLTVALAAICSQLSAEPKLPWVDIDSKEAILHLGSIDSFDVTEGGTRAARNVIRALENDDKVAAKTALEIYERLIPSENFGGEYTALQWFCEFVVTTPDERQKMLADPLSKAFFDHFAANGFQNLKEYLQRKYRIVKFGDEDTIEAHMREASLEDFILFNNPRRERWEKSSKMLSVLDIKEGETIADVGCGPGFFSFKFASLVGPKGKVYGIEVNPEHVEYVTKTAERLGFHNIEAIQSKATDIGLKDRKADLVYMCSLYHIIYTVFDEVDRDSLIESIKKAMKPESRLVIVDNGLVDDTLLPYHGPYISKDLIIGQLHHYGFRLVKTEQVIPQRYILTFRLGDGAQVAETADPKPNAVRLPIATKSSLMHIPNDLSAQPLIAGRKAARLFHSALEKQDRATAAKAREEYLHLFNTEKVGDEYSAFIWFCDYLVADPARQKQMIADTMTASYFERLSKNNYEVIRDYLHARFFLDKSDDTPVDELLRPPVPEKNKGPQGTDNAKPPAPGGQTPPVANAGATPPANPKDATKPADPNAPRPSGNEFVSIKDSLAVQFLNKGRDQRPDAVKKMSGERIAYWRDFILFNNPNRPSWEKTDRMLEVINAKEGQGIADIGCGPGFFSFIFAKSVGPKGRVYAIDTNKEHVDYINELSEQMNLRNVEAIESKLNDTLLPENSVDTAYMCSLYTPVYTTGMNKVTSAFIGSIKRSLRPDGRLIVVDNAVVKAGERPYHGPFMAKEIIAAHLKQFGFDLVETHQFIPQRYMLVFKISPAANAK